MKSLTASARVRRWVPRGWFAALILAPLFLSGCALFVSSPRVAIADVRVLGVGLTGGTAEVLLEVENPNRFVLEVREFRYRLELSDPSMPDRWDTLAEGVSDRVMRLEARSTTTVPIEVPFRYQALGIAVRAVLQGNGIPYRVEGAVQASGAGVRRNLPFRATGTLTP
jgi:LEA14-like dessication related protein